MLTAGEIQAIEAALGEADRAVATVEAAAKDARNWLAWVGVKDATTSSAEELAAGMRRTWTTIRQKRDALAELGGFDHEGALLLVEAARRLVRNAPANVAAIRGLVASTAPVNVAANVAADTARDLTRAAASSAPAWGTVFRFLPAILLGFAGFAVWLAFGGRGRA